MNCDSIKPKLLLLELNNVTPAEKSEIQAHLNTCHACQQELKMIKKSWDDLNLLPSLSPTPHFSARFWEKVRRQEVPSKWGWDFQWGPALVGFFCDLDCRCGVGNGVIFSITRRQNILAAAFPNGEPGHGSVIG